ncbi:hypothetical protein F4860DRAFT_464476 [Xylaria cubensis]|nr:hypothetical protein F4860DRAFT_464476 [Xylaria cubensis]
MATNNNNNNNSPQAVGAEAGPGAGNGNGPGPMMFVSILRTESVYTRGAAAPISLTTVNTQYSQFPAVMSSTAPNTQNMRFDLPHTNVRVYPITFFLHNQYGRNNQNGHGQNGHGQNGHGQNGHGQNGHGQNGHGQNGHGQSGFRRNNA